MTVVISYTRPDQDLADRLAADLRTLGHDVWIDNEIQGGETWWREVTESILNAEVLVFALSDHSWRSMPCRSELEYAGALGIPVLPVQVGPLDASFDDLLGGRAIIDYREPWAYTKLAQALADLTASPVVRPEPAPAPPELPFSYLYRIAEALGPERLSPERQGELIGQLRHRLAEESDVPARMDILKLLNELRARSETTFNNVLDIADILHAFEAAQAAPAQLSAPAESAPAESAPAQSPSTKVARVFISYRRQSTSHIAGRLADRLTDELGAQQVFMDVDSIDFGLDFRNVIAEAVGRSDVLLAVIGPGWADARDPSGHPRLADPDDLVRLEVESALQRNTRVIPVLVDDAEMPRAQELPASLTLLTRRNGFRIRHETFRQDVRRLLDTIRRVL